MIKKTDLTLLVNNVNLFACNAVGAYLMSRVDEASLRSEDESAGAALSLKGFALHYLLRADQVYSLCSPLTTGRSCYNIVSLFCCMYYMM